MVDSARFSRLFFLSLESNLHIMPNKYMHNMPKLIIPQFKTVSIILTNNQTQLFYPNYNTNNQSVVH